jgi:retron-type reverse transcriptase
MAREISPLLSNIYLNPLDHLMAQEGFEMVRYADDFVIMCRSPEEAARALAVVQEWTAEADLTLHPEKTKIVDATKEAGLTHHNSDTGTYGKFRILSKPRLLPYSFATFR